MLNIEHLTKTYGGKAAVQDLSLHIRPGEICAFIGHNGAGKTTTLKCCCGIQQFDSGRITVDGISVQDDPLECKRRLAYLPDNPDLYEYMTGIQYLNFIAISLPWGHGSVPSASDPTATSSTSRRTWPSPSAHTPTA